MISWDANAGGPLLPKVAEHLTTSLRESWGNPSSVHQIGRRARKRLDEARERVAKALGASSPREIIFTGSGSEAAALAIVGAWRARKDRSKRRVVTTTIEHPCVLGAMDVIERDGAEVVRVAPGGDGAVPAEAVMAAITSDTLLCSVMAVNNETGVVQPAGALARACTARGVLFHCDAVQAFGRLPTSLRELPVDLLSFSAHKLGGPAGVGVLFDRRAVDVEALTPGHQENGRRGGTQSVAFAEAAAMALEHAVATADEFTARVTPLRDAFEREVLARLPGLTVNGAGATRVGNTSNLTFDGVDGEALLIALDLAGICVSTGAACASGSVSPSHVLLAMGLTSSQAHSTLRFSLGPDANQAQVDEVVAALVRLPPGCRE